jgi:hypothetical protein
LYVSGVERRWRSRSERGEKALSVGRWVVSARRVGDLERTVLRLLWRLVRLWACEDGERVRRRLEDDGVEALWRWEEWWRWWWWCRWAVLSSLGARLEDRCRSLESGRLRRGGGSLLGLLSCERPLGCLVDGRLSGSRVLPRLASLAARGTGDAGPGSAVISRARSGSLSLTDESSGLHWSISWARRNPAM